jgi:hypothetical protein
VQVGDTVLIVASEKRLRSIGAWISYRMDPLKTYLIRRSELDPWGLTWQLSNGYWYATEDLETIPPCKTGE